VARQVLKRNQYGGTVGGPVMLPHVVDGRNKAVFLLSPTKGSGRAPTLQAGKITTFTPLEAQGNFSQSVNGGPDPAVAAFLLANPYFQGVPSLASQAIIDPTRISKVSLNYFKDGLIPHLFGRLSVP
jgi:hypothetical protein